MRNGKPPPPVAPFPAELREDTLSGIPPFKAAFVGAPPQWGFARHGLGLRRVRGGSCAPNAMPPFAPPCGHFASLVRSFATLIARVPFETLRVSAAHLASLQTGKPPPLPAPCILSKIETSYESAGGGMGTLSWDARKGGMAFGAHEPPRTRRQPRPCRANPHCGGAPTNAALKGGLPESVSSRSTAERGIVRIINRCRSVVTDNNF